MFNVTRRVSFAVAIALTVGWGIFFLLFLASSTTLMQAQLNQAENIVILPAGVKINIQVDKKIYRAGEKLLIAVRNDSRSPIWVKTMGADCPSGWWSLERLQDDGETWSTVSVTNADCSPTGIVRFTAHTLKSDEWKALVPKDQNGDILVDVPVGTYRIALPFVKGKTMMDTTWPNLGVEMATSASFSIL